MLECFKRERLICISGFGDCFGFRISGFEFSAMIFFVILLILTFIAQIVEIFIPPLEWMYNAHI